MARMEATQVVAGFERALDNILARVSVSVADSPRHSLALAYSGGLDSSVLLHLVHSLAAKRGIRLVALHVHHGLSPNADGWLAHCERESARLGVTFDARRVNVARSDGSGPEAAARIARYAALGEMCRAHQVPFLLTAHHLDDQAETVLLQMLRGAGPAGISGMSEAGSAPDLLGDAQTQVVRPLLGIPRFGLKNYADTFGITHIEDESNADVRYPRNALRNEIWPLLQAHFPAFRECVARSAHHAQSAQRLLEQLAQQDLAACRSGNELEVVRLRDLGDERFDNLLRHWLALNGSHMPSTAWLNEARTQLLEACADAQVCVTLDGVHLRRYRNRIMLTSVPPLAEQLAPLVFRWNGEPFIPFPAFGGVLRFEEAESGMDAGWLRQQNLRMDAYRGSVRLKPAPNRPARSLKDHCQDRGIPAWERQRMPLVYAGDALLFASGIGQDCRLPQATSGIVLRWEQGAT